MFKKIIYNESMYVLGNICFAHGKIDCKTSKKHCKTFLRFF